MSSGWKFTRIELAACWTMLIVMPLVTIRAIPGAGIGMPTTLSVVCALAVTACCLVPIRITELNQWHLVGGSAAVSIAILPTSALPWFYLLAVVLSSIVPPGSVRSCFYNGAVESWSFGCACIAASLLTSAGHTPLLRCAIAYVTLVTVDLLMFGLLRTATRQSFLVIPIPDWSRISLSELALAQIATAVTFTAPWVLLWIAPLIMLMVHNRRQDIVLNATVELSRRDPLTGLLNRRGIHDEITQMMTTNTPLAIGLLDIDYFKKINDEHGHDEGDRALIAAARALESIMSHIPCDSAIGRYGGEEFLIVLRIDTPDLVMERTRRQTSEALAQWGSSASLGWVSWTPDSNLTMPDAVRRADDALYQAKDLGRNQSVAA